MGSVSEERGKFQKHILSVRTLHTPLQGFDSWKKLENFIDENGLGNFIYEMTWVIPCFFVSHFWGWRWTDCTFSLDWASITIHLAHVRVWSMDMELSIFNWPLKDSLKQQSSS